MNVDLGGNTLTRGYFAGRVVGSDSTEGGFLDLSDIPAIGVAPAIVGGQLTFSNGVNTVTTSKAGGGVTLTFPNISNGTVALLSDDSVKMVESSETVTNSSTLMDSTALQVTLIPGSYWVETLELVGSSAYATSGCKAALVFTGTGTFKGTAFRGGQSSVEPINNAVTWGGTAQAMNATLNFTTTSGVAQRRGTLTVTAAGTLKVQFAQSSAASGQTVSLYPGSFLKVTRLSY